MEESKKQITLNRFPCTSCGLCCKNITGIIELIEFDAGNGVCKFLDLETNLCKIYESRPLICRIDEVHKKIYSHLDGIRFRQAQLEDLRDDKTS
ncbi:YkgJ family cysteine cluster protein [Helicobacter pylori]|nr:YkgJ family cysteine cluster protein [Helicobacter pylori]WQZ89595.1 YkgJ family cysteine cluster protein [Helicobacter pylori]